MTAEFRRYRIPVGDTNGTIRWQHALREKGLMLPRINYNEYNTKPYQWTYGISHYADTHDFVNQSVKIDVEEGAVVKHWYIPGHYPGEPVFAPRPGATEEDDGVILSTIYDSHLDKSYLLILDGKTFDPLATAIPIRRCLSPAGIPTGDVLKALLIWIGDSL
jgi:carotenoid cleavage dioxygenase-like enzyme